MTVKKQLELRELEEENIRKHHEVLNPWDFAVLESLVRPIKLDKSLDYLRELGLAYAGNDEQQGVMLIMPDELLQSCRESLTPAILQQVQQNEEAVQLTEGMLRYYGVIPTYEVYTRLKVLIPEMTIPRYYSLVHGVGVARGNIVYRYRDVDSSSFLVHQDVIDWEETHKAQQLRPYVTYRDLSRGQLLGAAAEPTALWNEQRDALIAFLLDKGVSGEEAVELADYAYFCILNGEDFATTLEDLGDEQEFTLKDLNECMGCLQVINNTSPLWMLKGHSPQGVRQMLNDSLPSASKRAPTERKVGRNEPCSCGSGKKYKHCCGKPDWLS